MRRGNRAHSRSTKRRRFAFALSVLLAAGGYAGCNYAHYDMESRALTDDVRRMVQGSFVKLSDGVVHYQIAGSAEARTVVLVHGFSVPYFIWDPTFDALVSSGLRVLRYDLYGRGYSDRPDVPYDAALYDRQLSELLDALGIGGPVDLAGLSMGGPVVVRFANRHPTRVRSIVLVDPAFHDGLVQVEWRLRTPVVGEYVMAVDVAPSLAEAQLDDFRHPEGHEDYVAKFREQMRFKGFRRALLSTRRHTVADDGEFARVGEGRLPVLLFWGREDRSVPFAVSDRVRRAIPQAQFHPIDDAGHIPQYERADEVARIWVAFLAGP